MPTIAPLRTEISSVDAEFWASQIAGPHGVRSFILYLCLLYYAYILSTTIVLVKCLVCKNILCFIFAIGSLFVILLQRRMDVLLLCIKLFSMI